MHTHEFAVGQKVHHKSGGPTMVVIEVGGEVIVHAVANPAVSKKTTSGKPIIPPRGGSGTTSAVPVGQVRCEWWNTDTGGPQQGTFHCCTLEPCEHTSTPAITTPGETGTPLQSSALDTNGDEDDERNRGGSD